MVNSSRFKASSLFSLPLRQVHWIKKTIGPNVTTSIVHLAVILTKQSQDH